MLTAAALSLLQHTLYFHKASISILRAQLRRESLQIAVEVGIEGNIAKVQLQEHSSWHFPKQLLKTLPLETASWMWQSVCWRAARIHVVMGSPEWYLAVMLLTLYFSDRRGICRPRRAAASKSSYEEEETIS